MFVQSEVIVNKLITYDIWTTYTFKVNNIHSYVSYVTIVVNDTYNTSGVSACLSLLLQYRTLLQIYVASMYPIKLMIKCWMINYTVQSNLELCVPLDTKCSIYNTSGMRKQWLFCTKQWLFCTLLHCQLYIYIICQTSSSCSHHQLTLNIARCTASLAIIEYM